MAGPRVVDFNYINNQILVNDMVDIAAVPAAPGRPAVAAIPAPGAMLMFTYVNDGGNIELFIIKEGKDLREYNQIYNLGDPLYHMNPRPDNQPIDVPGGVHDRNSNYFQTRSLYFPPNIALLPIMLLYLNRVRKVDLINIHRYIGPRLTPIHLDPNGFDISLGGTIALSINNHIIPPSFRLKCKHRFYKPGGLKGFIGGTRKVGENVVPNAIREFMEETGIEGLLNKFNLRNDWDNQLIFHEAGFTDIGLNALGRNVIIYNCNNLEKRILERIYHSFRRDVGYPEFRRIAALPPLNPISHSSLVHFNTWLGGRPLAVALAPVVLLPLPAPVPALPLPLHAVNDRTILNANVALPVSRHGGYYAKYLKYKQKYQELKEKLNGGLIEPSALLPAGRFLDDDMHNASISRRWAESLLAGSINYAFQGNIIIFTDNRPLVTSIRDDRIIIGDDEYYFIENVNSAILNNLVNERLCRTIIRKIPVVDSLRFITLRELLDELRLRGVAVPVGIRVDVFYINRTI
uniref:Nudix hydrolase domain-containing protein n=1 Tax=viral metagenome TaxID=1070528 RepID=A0A6C0H186_9ZZZZ